MCRGDVWQHSADIEGMSTADAAASIIEAPRMSIEVLWGYWFSSTRIVGSLVAVRFRVNQARNVRASSKSKYEEGQIWKLLL